MAATASARRAHALLEDRGAGGARVGRGAHTLVEAGVLGYVTRDESLDEVVAAITSVVLDQMVGSPKLRTLLIKRVRTLAAEYRPSAGETLTARERQCSTWSRKD